MTHATMQPNAMQPVYNEANLLERLDVWVRFPGAVADLNRLGGAASGIASLLA